MDSALVSKIQGVILELAALSAAQLHPIGKQDGLMARATRWVHEAGSPGNDLVPPRGSVSANGLRAPGKLETCCSLTIWGGGARYLIVSQHIAAQYARTSSWIRTVGLSLLKADIPFRRRKNMATLGAMPQLPLVSRQAADGHWVPSSERKM